MKKLLLLIVCLVAGITSSFGQEKGDMGVGMNLNYGSEFSIGLGAKYQYNVTDNIRLEPEFNYYFKHDGATVWDMGLNVQYLFHVADDVVVYPLAGLGYAHVKCDYSVTLEDYEGNSQTLESGSASDGEIQFKFGAGAEYRLTDTFKIVVEPKFQLIDNFNQFVLTAGVVYNF